MLEQEQCLNIEACVCVFHYNQNIGGTDMKDQLPQMYLVERKRMIKLDMICFRRVLDVTALNSLITFINNVGWKVV
jgi:hypothetical protein